MALPDPSDHAPDCVVIETGKPPALVIQFDPGVDASSVLLSVWERCTGCGAVTAFDQTREPWRRFHRGWRAYLAVWIATWEHRHDLGGRPPRVS